MEQTMASGAGLTSQQKQLLALVLQEPYFLKTFYLSGGTALSSWYFHHRESYDLDFFSFIPFDYERIVRWFRQNKEAIEYTNISVDEDYGFLMINLRFADNARLKIDFNHYSKTKISPGIRWKGLEIDSLIDITVNKIQTIATLPRTRDYVDLYCILKTKPWTIDALLVKREKKFGDKIDALQLAKNLLKVTEYTDFPIMLGPFDEEAMYTFYENLARELRPQILR